MRTARQYVLLHPDDCDPPHRLDLSPGSRDTLKVEWLTEMFARDGFSRKHSALVGYPIDGRVQLASGTHRHEAAVRAGIRLPVTLMLRSDVEAMWGTPRWADFIRDIAVEDLELAPVPEGGEAPGLDERVDLARDIELAILAMSVRKNTVPWTCDSCEVKGFGSQLADEAGERTWTLLPAGWWYYPVDYGDTDGDDARTVMVHAYCSEKCIRASLERAAQPSLDRVPSKSKSGWSTTLGEIIRRRSTP